MTKIRKKEPRQRKGKVHPWRLCPAGEHWVITHPMHVPPSKRHPDGCVTTRHGHCAHNPTGKDQLYPDEIKTIAACNFSKLKNLPCPNDLGFHKNGNKYDELIAGWVQYWNEVLQPDAPLDPSLVKALIASESGFNPRMLANKNNQNSARGLSQIRNDTRKILGDEKGELKDHYLTITREELNDPNVNICSGVRWLFWKRERASAKLGRTTTWEEGVAEYKGVLKDWLAGKAKGTRNMAPFLKYLKEARTCGAS